MSLFERIGRFLAGGRFSGGNGASGAGPVGSSEDETISCMEAVTFLQEYLDGELPEAMEDKVESHFDVCARCYPHLQLEESFRAAVRRAAAGRSAPPELKSRVAELVAQAERE